MSLAEILSLYWPYLLSGFMCMMLAVITAVGWHLQQMDRSNEGDGIPSEDGSADWRSLIHFTGIIAVISLILGGVIPLCLMGETDRFLAMISQWIWG